MSDLPKEKKKNLVAQFRSLILSQKRNLQNLSVLVFINYLIAGLGFFTKVKIANTLGKADFGLLAYGFAIACYGGAIIRFGLDRTFVRNLIHYPEKKGQIVAATIILRGLLFVLVALVLIIWKFFSPPTSDLTWGVILVAIGNSMFGLELVAVYDSMGQFNRHSVYNLIQRCLYFTAVWLTIILFPKNLSIFWLGVFTIASVTVYLIMQCRWAFYRLDFTGVIENIGAKTLKLARGNLIIWFSSLACLSFGAVNQIVLKIFKGNEALGGYSAAWQFVLVAMLFLTQIARIGSPATARVTKPGIDSNIKIRFLIKYSTVMFLAVLPISLVSIFFPELILRIIFSPEYITAAASLRVFGFYILAFSIGLVASQYVISALMERVYFVSVLIGGILGLILCMIMIPMMGEVGAALALLISHSLTMAAYWCACIMNIKKGYRFE